MRTISVDFESYYEEGEYSIREMGAKRYLRDERFDPYLISVCDGSQAWAGHLKDFNWDALNGQTLLSHNAGFDSAVQKELVRRKLAPQITPAAWHCTANLTTFLAMRRDLARAAEFLLGVQVDKSYRIDASGRHWSDMVAAGVAEKVKEAGRVDAARCHQFWTRYSHLWPTFERKLSDITIRQCQRGAQIDENLLAQYLTIAQTMLIQAEGALPWMKEGKKPTSPKAIAEECRKVGMPCPPVKSHKGGEEAYEDWVATYAHQYAWVKAYSDYRVINKFIEQLQTIKGRLFDDGIFNYELLYFGAHTGRWAGAGGFNMQNMRKTPLYCDCDGWLITDAARLTEIMKSKQLPSYVAHVLDIRKLFIARPGRKLILSDLSQIEPRVLAWLVGDTAMLASMAAGQTPYEGHARSTMNWTGGELKYENKELYALAKARVLGLGYGCGWKKFITVAMTMAGLDITTEDPEWIEAVNDDGVVCRDKAGNPIMVSGYGQRSKQIVTDYRASNPKVVALWKQLDDAFRDSVGGNFEMTLPSGRKLRYPEVRRERKAVADPDDPKKWSHRWVTTALAFDQKRNAVVRKPFYGGLLAENLDQATSRDVFGEHLIALDETSGIDVLWSCHDEAVNEVDQNITKADVEHIMSKTPEWLEGCPIAAEAIETPHYLK